MAVALLVVGDRRDDAHAQPELDVGLDHVRVHRHQHDVEVEPGRREGVVDVRAAGVAGLVGDDRELRQALQRQRRAGAGLGLQRMARRHQHRVGPAVARQRQQLRMQRQRFGGDADVGLAVDQQPRDLLRRALRELQADLGMGLAEIAHRRRQRVARLAVRGGDAQMAAVGAGEVLAGAAQVLGLAQQPLDDGHHVAARLGQAGQALAGAHEDVDAELVLELADLPAHAGLRGVQRLRHLGQVEVAALGLADGSELLEVHRRQSHRGDGSPASTAFDERRESGLLMRIDYSNPRRRCPPTNSDKQSRGARMSNAGTTRLRSSLRRRDPSPRGPRPRSARPRIPAGSDRRNRAGSDRA